MMPRRFDVSCGLRHARGHIVYRVDMRTFRDYDKAKAYCDKLNAPWRSAFHAYLDARLGPIIRGEA